MRSAHRAEGEPALGPAGAPVPLADVGLLLAIGGLGFMMRRYGLPVLPAIIG